MITSIPSLVRLLSIIASDSYEWSEKGTMSSSIVLTGAAGSVATRLRPLLRSGDRRVVLVDVAPVADLAPSETAVQTSITQIDELVVALSGADTLIHLAG